MSDSLKEFVVSHGVLNYEETSLFLKNMDIQFHLSCRDACPNSVIEGLMAGLPIIAPKHTGTAEVIGDLSNIWCIEENIDIPYFPISSKQLPKIPMQNYINLFDKIIDNLKSYKLAAHEYAVDNLDIKNTAQEYKKIIDLY